MLAWPLWSAAARRPNRPSLTQIQKPSSSRSLEGFFVDWDNRNAGISGAVDNCVLGIFLGSRAPGERELQKERFIRSEEDAMHRSVVLLSAFVLGAVAHAERAVVPPEGGFVNVPLDGSTTGYDLVDSMTSSLVEESGFRYGAMESRVFRHQVRKQLLFTYRWHAWGSPGSSELINERIGFDLAIIGFRGFSTAVSHDPSQAFWVDPAPIAIDYAFRSGNEFHQTYNVVWSRERATPMIFVETNATAYSVSQAHSYRYEDWLPTGEVYRFPAQSVIFAPVPEPATMLALGAGVAALVRRRKKA